MGRVMRCAKEALEKYLLDSQEKTDEILRRFSTLETLFKSDQSAEEQLRNIRKIVTDRPDLCEFSRLHTEYGGKNEYRFLWHFFKSRRAEMLRILHKLKLSTTSHDANFERSLAFMLENSHRHNEWITFKTGNCTELTSYDLNWVPEKWWKLLTGESHRKITLTKINRRQFEVCVCSQIVSELKSGDLCVMGSDAYSDYRDELVPMEECERTRIDYGEKVSLPINSDAFIAHIHTMLTESAQQVDKTYQVNPYFTITDGRPKLLRYEKKPIPHGFKELDEALKRKLNNLDISLLDVLADTEQWIGWSTFQSIKWTQRQVTRRGTTQNSDSIRLWNRFRINPNCQKYGRCEHTTSVFC